VHVARIIVRVLRVLQDDEALAHHGVEQVQQWLGVGLLLQGGLVAAAVGVLHAQQLLVLGACLCMAAAAARRCCRGSMLSLRTIAAVVVVVLLLPQQCQV
jgi:hypothetical protein